MSLLLLLTYNSHQGMSHDNRDRVRREQKRERLRLLMRRREEEEFVILMDGNSGTFYG